MNRLYRTACIILNLALTAAAMNGADASPPAGSATAPFTIVCLGDSITGDRPDKPYLANYLKWTDIIGAEIEGRCGPGSAHVINAGFGGDRTFPMGDKPGAITRYKTQVIGAKPGIAVILIGGNDVGTWKDKDDATKAKGRADFTTNLTTIVTDCQAAGIKVLLLQYHCLPNPAHPETAWTHLNDYNDAIAAVGVATATPVLDMAAPMQAALSAGVPLTELVNENDGVHLAPHGELVYAVTIYRKLNDLGWLPPVAP